MSVLLQSFKFEEKKWPVKFFDSPFCYPGTQFLISFERRPFIHRIEIVRKEGRKEGTGMHLLPPISIIVVW